MRAGWSDLLLFSLHDTQGLFSCPEALPQQKMPGATPGEKPEACKRARPCSGGAQTLELRPGCIQSPHGGGWATPRRQQVTGVGGWSGASPGIWGWQDQEREDAALGVPTASSLLPPSEEGSGAWALLASLQPSKSITQPLLLLASQEERLGTGRNVTQVPKITVGNRTFSALPKDVGEKLSLLTGCWVVSG